MDQSTHLPCEPEIQTIQDSPPIPLLPQREQSDPTDHHHHQKKSDSATNHEPSTRIKHRPTADQLLSAPTTARADNANQHVENLVYSNLNQTSSSNGFNEPLNQPFDHLNSHNLYYDSPFYFTNPSDPLLSYQQSLLEHYQQNQLQQSYYSFPSRFEPYYDSLQQQLQLQQQQFNYPFSSTMACNSLEFDPFLNLDPSQQSQVQSYYPFSSGPNILQPESFSNHVPSTPFFYDEVPLSQDIIQDSQLSRHLDIPDYQYIAKSREVLGTRFDDKGLHPLSIRRCFNCGDSSHSLVACPEPRNEPLIRLTKQIFQARTQNEDDQDGNFNLQDEGWSRFKESLNDNTKDSIDRRKLLVTMFTPGQVSNTLREALFWEKNRGEPDENYLDPSRPMPWFQTMEKWGYPPSYVMDPVSARDPFQAVRERISELEKDKAWDSLEILEMHEERLSDNDLEDEDIEADDEEILKMLVPGFEACGRPTIPLPSQNTHSSESLTFPDLNSLSPPPDTPGTAAAVKRLVQYKGGNFSSDRLPVYDGHLISARRYLDQYSSTTTNNHHFSQRRSDNHYHLHSRKSPRPSRSSSPSCKSRRSPYSNSHHLRTNSPPHINQANNLRATKEDEGTGKAQTQRWKDAALTFAATQQKVQPPAPPPTASVTKSHNSSNGNSARNKFYVDPDTPLSNSERSIYMNEELNYSDDLNREGLNHPTGDGRQRNNYKDESLSKRKRGGRSTNNNHIPGASSRQRNRNRNLNAAQVFHNEDRSGMGKNKNNHRIGEAWVGGIPRRTCIDNTILSSMEKVNKRKITNAYQEEEINDSSKELITISNNNDEENTGQKGTKGVEQKHRQRDVLSNRITNSTQLRLDNSSFFIFGQNTLNHSDIPPPPLPLSPPPDDPDPPPSS